MKCIGIALAVQTFSSADWADWDTSILSSNNMFMLGFAFTT